MRPARDGSRARRAGTPQALPSPGLNGAVTSLLRHYLLAADGPQGMSLVKEEREEVIEERERREVCRDHATTGRAMDVPWPDGRGPTTASPFVGPRGPSEGRRPWSPSSPPRAGGLGDGQNRGAEPTPLHWFGHDDVPAGSSGPSLDQRPRSMSRQHLAGVRPTPQPAMVANCSEKKEKKRKKKKMKEGKGERKKGVLGFTGAAATLGGQPRSRGRASGDPIGRWHRFEPNQTQGKRKKKRERKERETGREDGGTLGHRQKPLFRMNQGLGRRKNKKKK